MAQVLLATDPSSRPRPEADMVAAFERHPSCTVVDVAAFDRGAEPLGRYDAVVVFEKFRRLRRRNEIDWRGFDGLRVLMDHDAFWDYADWTGSVHRNAWTETIPRLGFDLAVVSGRATADHLRRRGIDAEVVHKAVATDRFRDLGDPRDGIAHYGTMYRARAAMLRHLDAAKVPVEQVSAPYLELNERLNAFAAVLVCNMGSKVRFGKAGRAVERIRPGTALQLDVAPEPMLKNFEAAAAGCATFMDHTADLDELGFIDGRTAIVYRDFNDLLDRIRIYGTQPESLRTIGAAAAELCARRHGWEHRVDRLLGIIEARVGA